MDDYEMALIHYSRLLREMEQKVRQRLSQLQHGEAFHVGCDNPCCYLDKHCCGCCRSAKAVCVR